jgi:arylsulfatase A-like enzyme
MADDIGDPGIGRIISRLPNIRRVFVEGGMRLTEMHGEVPLCTPGRANTLTGQHSLHNKVVRNDGDLLRPRGTVAFRLQRAGYHTMLGGKYLNNYSGRRVPIGWDRAKFLYPDAEGRLGRVAARWLTEAPVDRPVFAWFASSAAHKRKSSWHSRVLPRFKGAPECQGVAPFRPPTYQTWRKPKVFPRNMPYWPGGWNMTTICESMLQVDELVGMVAEAQAARGRPAHLIFMSDNGMAWGQKGYPGKHVPLATRLPFYWAGPGIASGVSSDALLSNIDIAPTIARIAGVPLPTADGQSFRGVLYGNDDRGRGKTLTLMPKGKVQWTSVRTHRWHYIRWKDGRRELYDVTGSHWEPGSANLARKRPALVRKLDRELARMVSDSRR